MMLRLLVRTWLLIAAVDFVFASTLSYINNSDPMRVWKGVASVLVGREAMDQGARAIGIGLLMHLGVALAWSTVFLALAWRWDWLRRVLATRWGFVAVAAVYGPLVWILMSMVVIPTVAGRPPAPVSSRWWLQFFAHIPFVAMPITWSVARGSPKGSAPAS